MLSYARFVLIALGLDDFFKGKPKNQETAKELTAILHAKKLLHLDLVVSIKSTYQYGTFYICSSNKTFWIPWQGDILETCYLANCGYENFLKKTLDKLTHL